MKPSEWINSLIPGSLHPLERAKARIVVVISFASGGAIIALVLFWALTNTLEDIQTLYVSAGFLFLLAAIIISIKCRYTRLGAWLITTLMALLNLSNMAWYGIGTSSSAGYLVPILLAFFSIGMGAGIGLTITGCAATFLIAYFASTGQLQTTIPYQESNLSFDAPVLTLIFIPAALVAGSWVHSSSKAFGKETA